MTWFAKENKTRFLMMLAGSVVSILFCCNFYLYSKVSEAKKKKADHINEIQVLKKENAELNKKLEQKESDVHYLKNQKNMLDKMIEKQKNKAKSKKTINSNKDQNA